MIRHDTFHAGNSLVSDSICILHFVLKEVAAILLDTCNVAVHTGGVGAVTLNACDLDALDLFPAGILSCLDCCCSACLSGLFVTGSDEGDNLVGRDSAVECHNRSVCVSDQCLDCVCLQRSNDVSIIAAGTQVGLDHVHLLVIRSL